MIALLRMICVAAALYFVALYFMGSSNEVMREMGKLKDQADSLAKQAPKMVEDFGDSVGDARESVSGAKNRLDSVRKEVEGSMEAERKRAEKAF